MVCAVEARTCAVRPSHTFVDAGAVVVIEIRVYVVDAFDGPNSDESRAWLHARCDERTGDLWGCDPGLFSPICAD